MLRFEVSRPDKVVDLGQLMLGIDFGIREREVSERVATGSSLSISFSVEDKSSVSWSLRCRSRESCGNDSYRGKDVVKLQNLRPGTYDFRAEAKRHYPDGDTFELTDGIAYSYELFLDKCFNRRCDPADRGIMLE